MTADRYLLPRLFYTDDCPEEYHAPGFLDVEEDVTMMVPHNGLWKLAKDTLGTVDSGFHK